MIKEPVFSIIIPVYNASKYLHRCLNSLLVQKIKNFEIILIDDLSTDNSVEIIRSYEEDDRIKLILSNENRGPSKARNQGLDIAKGEIILFVDADDYVSPDYLIQIKETYEKSNADVVFFGYYKEWDNSKKREKCSLPDYTGKFMNDIKNLTKAEMFGYTWIKAIKKSMVGNLRFDEDISIMEDEVFTCSVMTNKKIKIAFCNEPLYIYSRPETETLTTKAHKNFVDACDKVYLSWKNLLQNGDELLVSKANHLFQICNYYGLEKNVKPIPFWMALSDSKLIESVSSQDQFTVAVKNKKIFYLKLYWLKYNFMSTLKSFVNRKSGR